MANPWFRVWSDMVNDPKWRTIARKSGQKIGDVIAVYVHMMTSASNATERGRTEGWYDEDIATALDIDAEQVEAIRDAMQGRVLAGDYLTGWEKRQPLREDGAAERAKAWREGKKASIQAQPNATERNRTLDKSREDKSREEGKATTAPTADLFEGVDPQIVADFKTMRTKQKASITKTAVDGIRREAGKAGISLQAALAMCCERGWRGFNAGWVQTQQARASPQSYESAKDKSRREAMEQLTGRKQNEQRDPNIIDITPCADFVG